MPMATSLRDLGEGDRGYWLVRDLIEAVERRIRIPSGWNGHVYESSGPEVLGRAGRRFNDEIDPLHDWDAVTANADRSLTVRTDLLRHVLSAKKGIRDVTDNYKAHQSMLRIVQAAAQLSRDDIVADPAPAPGHREDAASEALTDGLTQAWALDNTNLIITDIDLNTRSPRVTATRTFDAMPHATAAARRFVKDLSEAAGRPLDVTHRELLSASPQQRWNVVADWLIDRNLTGLIDDRQRTGLRRELAGIAHDQYAHVADIPDRVAEIPDRVAEIPDRVAEIPDRVAEMPTRRSVDRVHLANALRRRGTEAGAWTVLQLNIKIKATMVNWGHQPDRVRAAAQEVGVLVDRLRSFLGGTADASGAPHGVAGSSCSGSGTLQPAETQQGQRGQRGQRAQGDRPPGPDATR
jgi:hypothetical protein